LDQENLHFKTSASAGNYAKCGLRVNDRAAVEVLLPASFVSRL
jgi:hypothetical protein